MSVNISGKINFIIPVRLDNEILSQKKASEKFFLKIGEFADQYAYIGKKHFSLSKQENVETKGAVWKTAVKIATYVLSALILPMLALVAKAAYKNWVNKNVILSPNSLPTQSTIETKSKEQQIEAAATAQKELDSSDEIQKSQQEISQEEKKPNPEEEKFEKIRQLNQTFLEKTFKDQATEERHTIALVELQKIAEVVLSLNQETNSKLTVIDNKLNVAQRGQSSLFKKEKNFGKSKSSHQALEIVIQGIRNALVCGIIEIEVAGMKTSIRQILDIVKKSPSQFVLQKNESLNQEFTTLESSCAKLEEEIVSQTLQDMQILEQILEEISFQTDARDSLLRICRAFPINRELFEEVLVKSRDPNATPAEKQEYRIKFPYLTNKALIEGLPIFKMSPLSFVHDMTILMSDPYIPIQIKDNLLSLYISLIQNPYYCTEIDSDEFREASQEFFQSIKNNKIEGWDKIVQKRTNHEKLFSEIQFKEINEKAELPIAESVIDKQKIEQIKQAILNGDKKEMKRIAKEIASSSAIYFASHLNHISYFDYLTDTNLTSFVVSTNKITEAIDLTFRETLYKKEDAPEHKEKIRNNYSDFITILIKHSVKVGNFNLGTVDAYSKEKNKIFDASNNFQNYTEFEKEFKPDAMIPLFAILLKIPALTRESVSSISMVDKIQIFNDCYHKFSEYQRRARFFLSQDE